MDKFSFVTCVFQIHLRYSQATKDKVDMAVDETWHSHASLQIDYLCIPAGIRLDLLVRTNCHKSSICYGNSFRKYCGSDLAARRQIRLPRPDPSVRYNKFSF